MPAGAVQTANRTTIATTVVLYIKESASGQGDTSQTGGVQASSSYPAHIPELLVAVRAVVLSSAPRPGRSARLRLGGVPEGIFVVATAVLLVLRLILVVRHILRLDGRDGRLRQRRGFGAPRRTALEPASNGGFGEASVNKTS